MPNSMKSPDPQADGLIRASSILMDYEEDTRKYLKSGVNSKKYTTHHIRHSSQKHGFLNPAHEDYTASNDAPLNENESDPIRVDAKTSSKVHPRARIRIPVRAIIYGRDDASFAPHRMHGTRRLKFGNNDTRIAFHSPVKIFIPVLKENNEKLESADRISNCVQCPSNITIIAARGDIDVDTPVPPISVCSRLAHQKGRLNVAVTSGPRPGIKIKEGDYATKFIVWKQGGRFYSCEYVLSVIVKKCEDVSSPSEGIVNCSNGNIWGSRCTFYCFSGYVLQGKNSIICKENSEKVSWSSPFPTCKSKKSTSDESSSEYYPVSRIPCTKLHQPHDGTVICNAISKQDLYPDGSVCQFFCYPGFVIENLSTSNTLVVCKNGLWTPSGNITCHATYCPEPKSPDHGSTRCEKNIKESVFKSKYKNGTICDHQCDIGYAIPRSQSPLRKIVCHAPVWKGSSPECKQIKIPQPHPKDCKNLILIANRRGIAKLKPPRFLISEELTSPKTHIFGNCTYKGKIGIGSYINNCSAYDEEFNISAFCTYSVTVKENICLKPPDVPHSSLDCNSLTSTYPKSTVCKYICNDGFVMPLRQRKFNSTICTSKLKWKPFSTPTCKKAIAPKPRKNHCLHQVLYLKTNNTSLKMKQPRFKSSLRGSKVKINCTLNGLLTAGNYTNLCEAFDTQLELTSSCIYNITVKERRCAVLPAISNGFITCSSPNNQHLYFPETICSYNCYEGYVIPTSVLQFSVKLCDIHGIWNSTLIPNCVSQSAPVPENDSCLDDSIKVEDLESFVITAPNFKSFSEANLDIKCEPMIIQQYSIHVINCSAYDPQLRVSGRCSFQLDVYSSNNMAEFQQAEIGCTLLDPITNGDIHCSNSHSNVMPLQTLCEVICHEGYIIPRHEHNTSFSECISEGEWNVSQISDCVKADPPILISGCDSETLKTSDLVNVKVTLPQFQAFRNNSVKVTCSPELFDEYKIYEVLCIAEDEELGTITSCSFYITLSNDQLSNFTNLPEYLTETTNEQQFKACGTLTLPSHGIISCSNETPTRKCIVSCEEGYAFSSSNKILRKGWIECNGDDGLWDYQRFDNSSDLPDCLALLPNTTVIVSSQFSASVEQCNATKEIHFQNLIKDVLLNLNRKVCDIIDCSTLVAKCDHYGNEIILLNVKWTLQSAYDPSKFEDTSDVPEFENNFETVLAITKKAIKQEVWLKEKLLNNGIQIDETSFTQGYIVLACGEDGYVVDMENNKCLACPSGTVQQKDKCVPCSSGYYQLLSGQTQCNICPNDTTIFVSNVPDTCLSY